MPFLAFASLMAASALAASDTSHLIAMPPIVLRMRVRRIHVDVEQRDLGAGLGQLGGGRGAEAGAAAGDDRGVSLDVHLVFLVASVFSISSAMPCPPPMQADAMP